MMESDTGKKNGQKVLITIRIVNFSLISGYGMYIPRQTGE